MQPIRFQDIPPISAVLWSEFAECPQIMYNLFESTLRPGGVTHKSDLVYDLSAQSVLQKETDLIVNNIEELHRVTNDLLSMPILFKLKVEHTRTDAGIVTIKRKWRDEFAVLVNTRHYSIRDKLSHKLTEAMQMMQENKKFCLKIDFGPSISQWYSGLVDAQPGFCDGRLNDDSGGTTIWVTNYSSPIESCFSPFCILGCFPFWLLFGGPCYTINRKVKCVDTLCEFFNLGVTMLRGARYVVQLQ